MYQARTAATGHDGMVRGRFHWAVVGGGRGAVGGHTTAPAGTRDATPKLRGSCRGYAPRCKPTPPLPSHGQPTTHSIPLRGRHRGGGPRASGPRSAGAGARRTYGVCHSGLVADRAGRLCLYSACAHDALSRKCAHRSGCKMPDASLVQSSDPLVTKELPGQGTGDPGGDAARQASSPFPSAKRGTWLTQAPP